MSATFPPLNETQRMEARVAKPGKYKVYLEKVEEKQTKSNNVMFSMVGKFHDESGRERTMFPNLVISDGNIENIYNFCQSIGRPELYETGKLDANDIRCNYAYVDVTVEHYEYNGKSGVKNVVKEWLRPFDDAPTVTEDSFKDDDIAF